VAEMVLITFIENIRTFLLEENVSMTDFWFQSTLRWETIFFFISYFQFSYINENQIYSQLCANGIPLKRNFALLSVKLNI
jgi:hypothetical protein